MQTKTSYRTLKWTLFMGLAATLASGCVVSTGDGSDDDVKIEGGDNTGNTGNKGGKGGTSAGMGGSNGGTGGTENPGGSGGDGGGPVTDPDYPGVCDSSLDTPSEIDPVGACTANDADNDCGACLKQKCCDTFAACYGKNPTSACGYGPSPSNDLGQFDALLNCYDEKNDGVLTIDEILLECDAEALNQCAATDDFLNEDTMDLVACALNGEDDDPDAGNDDCRDVCFPPLD